MYKMRVAPRIILDDETLVLRRYDNTLGAGLNIVDGRRTRATQPFVEFSIRCNVQPVTGDDLLQVPEGDRYNEQLFIWVWETSEKPQPNDYVLREGQQYLCMAATDWGSYCQARIQRIDVGPDRALGV